MKIKKLLWTLFTLTWFYPFSNAIFMKHMPTKNFTSKTIYQPRTANKTDSCLIFFSNMCMAIVIPIYFIKFKNCIIHYFRIEMEINRILSI